MQKIFPFYPVSVPFIADMSKSSEIQYSSLTHKCSFMITLPRDKRVLRLKNALLFPLTIWLRVFVLKKWNLVQLIVRIMHLTMIDLWFMFAFFLLLPILTHLYPKKTFHLRSEIILHIDIAECMSWRTGIFYYLF